MSHAFYIFRVEYIRAIFALNKIAELIAQINDRNIFRFIVNLQCHFWLNKMQFVNHFSTYFFDGFSRKTTAMYMGSESISKLVPKMYSNCVFIYVLDLDFHFTSRMTDMVTPSTQSFTDEIESQHE